MPDAGDPVLPLQNADAQWIAETGTRYLAHEMRVGKTASAIRAADLLGCRRVLWLTTGVARLGHAHAWQKFSPFSHDLHVMMTRSQAVPTGRGVIISSYDLATGPLYERLLAGEYDALVLDEAHKLKTRTTKRTKAVFGESCDRTDGLAWRAEHVIPLSGTPAPNHPGELWPVLRALFPAAIEDTTRGGPMPAWRFEKRFCKMKYNPFGEPKIVGGKNMPELRKRIAPYFLRRKFAETYPDAAGAQVEQLFVDAHGRLDDLRELEQSTLMAEYTKRLERAADESRKAAILDELEHRLGLRLRRLTGLAKAPGVIEWAKEYLADRQKLVLFAYHTDVIDALCEGLSRFRPIRVSGGASPKVKSEAESVFRDDPNRRVFVGNWISAGEAIDLSVADDLVLVESSWVPGENEQAIRRIMNMNKRRENIAWFATLAGSIDEHVQRTAMRKAADLVQVFG